MSKTRHWHWTLMIGVFVAAYLFMARSAAMAAVVS
jgi:hypothetical protein